MPAEPQRPSLCPNCDEALGGRYCSACGQDCGNLRLESRAMLVDAAGQLLGWEGALLRTMRGLWRDPGGLALDFVNGRRKSYLNPARFCFVSLALWMLMLKLFDFDVLFAAGVEFDSDDPATAATVQQLRGFLSRNFDWLLFTALPLRAVALKVAFRRAGYTVAACLVQILYVAGFGFLIGALLIVLDAAGLMGASQLRPLVAFVWAVRSARSFFGVSWLQASSKIFVVTFIHMLVTVLVGGMFALSWLVWTEMS